MFSFKIFGLTFALLLGQACTFTVLASDTKAEMQTSNSAVSVNFDGVYESRGYKTPSGIPLPDQNLTIKDGAGELKKVVISLQPCLRPTPIRIIQSHGPTVDILFNRAIHEDPSCSDSIVQFKLIEVDGKTGLASLKDPEHIMFVKVAGEVSPSSLPNANGDFDGVYEGRGFRPELCDQDITITGNTGISRCFKYNNDFCERIVQLEVIQSDSETMTVLSKESNIHKSCKDHITVYKKTIFDGKQGLIVVRDNSKKLFLAKKLD